MDSSVVTLQSAEGQDTQQRPVNSAVGNEEEGSTLHPAAAVFRDEILGNVSESSKTLETSNECFRHITGLVQVSLNFVSSGVSTSSPSSLSVKTTPLVCYHYRMSL